KIAIAVILIATLAVVFWNLARMKPTTPTQESPFESAVKEANSAADSTTARPAAPSPATTTSSHTDSLVLKATTTDSVWMQIVIDKLPPQQYLFKPHSARSWKAKERFSVSLGNAGAIEFTLDGKRIGTLGKRGAVVRNVELKRETPTHK
ncbi:MAG: DUF4115 domain-containing protein, partial [Bacteroidota bacterium]